jgi:hypothetical protein
MGPSTTGNLTSVQCDDLRLVFERPKDYWALPRPVRAVQPDHFRVSAGLAQLFADKGICANGIAPRPIWTPHQRFQRRPLQSFGKRVPMKRPGPPAELATGHVMLAVPLSNDVSGATFAATGGKPIL